MKFVVFALLKIGNRIRNFCHRRHLQIFHTSKKKNTCCKTNGS